MIRSAASFRSLRAVVGVALLVAFAGCEPADRLEQARELQAAGDLAGSLEPLRELVAERPGDGEVAYLYGRALVFVGQPGSAVWPLRQALEDPEWRLPAGIQLAQVALAASNFNEVVDVTTRLLEDDPEAVMPLLLRAQARAHWKKDPEAALADARRVLELAPEVVEAYEPLILALLLLDRHPEAREALAEAGERITAAEAPAQSLAWHCATTAVFSFEAGEVEEARGQWEACLGRFPAQPAVVNGAVEFYATHGEPDRAVAALRGALEETPTHLEYRVALASWLRATGEASEGEALLREATEAEDPAVAALGWIALARYRRELREHAADADALERAMEKLEEAGAPANPQLQFEYADALLMSGQYRRALEEAEEIPVSAQRAMIRGRVAQEQGDAAAALAAFDEALRVWPNNAVARYYAARAAEVVGDFDRALEEYRYSIRVDMGATDARTRASRILIAEGRPSLAYQLLFLEADKHPLEPEGELLSIYLMARAGNRAVLQQSLLQIASRDPSRLPIALAGGAEGARDLAGPAAALTLLDGAPGIDYGSPVSAPALRLLVRYAHEVGQPEPAGKLVEVGRQAHPEEAVFHEIEGLHLELGGADPEGARASYTRAAEIDAANAGALAGLGRLALESDPAGAVSLFERAAAADPSEPEYALAAARALRAVGDAVEARRRLDALLADHPLEGEVAAELVSLDLESGAVTERTAERARRAARLGGGPEDWDALGGILGQLGRAEEAQVAIERARRLRELAAARRKPQARGDQ